MTVFFFIPPPTVLKKNLQKILSSSFSSKGRLSAYNLSILAPYNIIYSTNKWNYVMESIFSFYICREYGPKDVSKLSLSIQNLHLIRSMESVLFSCPRVLIGQFNFFVCKSNLCRIYKLALCSFTHPPSPPPPFLMRGRV